MDEKSGQNRFLIAIATIVFSIPILKMPVSRPVSLLYAAPEPEWYPVSGPTAPVETGVPQGDSVAPTSITRADFQVCSEQGTDRTIIQVSAALEAFSEALEVADRSLSRPLFGTIYDWQSSQSGLFAGSPVPVIPLPPILDGSQPQPGQHELPGEEADLQGTDLNRRSLTTNSQVLADPFLEADEGFVEAAPHLATLYQSGPQPTPTELVPPPAANDDQKALEQKHAAEILFQKRVGELNRSITGIQLGYPSNKGAFPPNQAAELTSQHAPLLVSGVDGWFEPRPNRYPVPFAYQPLYYEEMNLERCGKGHGFFQPLFSSAAFAKNTITLPYQLIAHPPRSLVATPGDCPSCHRFPCR